MQKLLSILIFVLTFTLLSGCVYKIPVQQGNIITENDVAKIQRGMSPTQVVNILGNPVLNNIYLSNKLTYVYTIQKGYRKRYEKRLYVIFINNRVTDVNYSNN